MAVTDILKRDPAAAARKELEASQRGLANAETRRAAAAAELEAADHAQAVVAMSDGDAAEGVLEASTRRVRDARDLLAALDDRVIPAARAAVVKGEQALDNAEREVRYRAAEAKRKAAAARFSKVYPEIVVKYAELVRDVCDADAAIDEANSALPEGAERLATVEATVRDWPAVDRHVVSDEIKQLWHHSTGDLVEDQSRVVGGKYQQRDSGGVHFLGTDHCRQFPKRVVVAIPYRPGVTGERLLKDGLPPLRPAEPADREPVTTYHSVPADDTQGASA